MTIGETARASGGAVDIRLDVRRFTSAILAVVLLWFVLGYVFYAALYAISGVIVSRQEDLQSSSTPVTMVLVAGYLVAFPVLEDPSSSLAVISSYVLFTSPIVMPVRVAVGEASTVEIAASLGILALAVALLVPLGARVYEGAVLRMGKPMRLREALRAARATP